MPTSASVDDSAAAGVWTSSRGRTRGQRGPVNAPDV